MQTFLFVLFLILAFLCGCYGITVRAIVSGTAFFAVWLVLALLFVCISLGIHMNVWKILPAIIKKLLVIFCSLGLASFLLIEGLVISKMHIEGPDNLDYIIVLGAQVYKNGPSPVLKFRLDKAYEYLSENPDTRCIVTGGQGYNEPFTEASCMADYLTMCGIDSERIIVENRSTTTAQNLTNSMQLITDKNPSLGILTNDFHMFRALQIANAMNIPNVHGISCSSTKIYLPNNMFREYFAEIKFLLKQFIHL